MLPPPKIAIRAHRCEDGPLFLVLMLVSSLSLTWRNAQSIMTHLASLSYIATRSWRFSISDRLVNYLVDAP